MLRRTRSHLAALLLATIIVASGTPAAAQDASAANAGEVSRVTQDVSQEVLSPFCPGKTLAMCPSPAAAKVRMDIQDMAREGLDKEAIKKRVIEEYGEEFRLVEPPLTDNVGLFALLVFGFGIAGFAVWWISARRRDDTAVESEKGEKSEPKPSDAEGDDYLDELRAQYRD